MGAAPAHRDVLLRPRSRRGPHGADDRGPRRAPGRRRRRRAHRLPAGGTPTVGRPRSGTGGVARTTSGPLTRSWPSSVGTARSGRRPRPARAAGSAGRWVWRARRRTRPAPCTSRRPRSAHPPARGWRRHPFRRGVVQRAQAHRARRRGDVDLVALQGRDAPPDGLADRGDLGVGGDVAALAHLVGRLQDHLAVAHEQAGERLAARLDVGAGQLHGAGEQRGVDGGDRSGVAGGAGSSVLTGPVSRAERGRSTRPSRRRGPQAPPRRCRWDASTSSRRPPEPS